MRDYISPAALPPHVLDRDDMREALRRRDFGTVFALARQYAGISFQKISLACDIKSERVAALARGNRQVSTLDKIERIADALRIPGEMIGLAPRPWERTRSADSVSLNPAAKHPPETLEESLIAADQARRLMDRAIAGDSVTSGRMESLEEITLRYGRQSVFTTPVEMLERLIFEFDEIRQLSSEVQSPNLQGRLFRVAAQICALTADELMVLGDARQAWAWHGTAKSAADATTDRAVQTQVRAIGTR